SHLLHPEQDAALHRLQPVARVRKRPRDDDRHRVVEVRRTHLILDATRRLSGWRWNFVDHVPTFSRLHSAGLAPTARRRHVSRVGSAISLPRPRATAYGYEGRTRPPRTEV